MALWIGCRLQITMQAWCTKPLSVHVRHRRPTAYVRVNRALYWRGGGLNLPKKGSKLGASLLTWLGWPWSTVQVRDIARDRL